MKHTPLQRFLKNTAKHFINLPRHARSEQVIQLKNMIRQDSESHGRYYTHTYLPKEGSVWSDFLFLGHDRFTLFNATITTCDEAYKEQINHDVFDRAYAMLSEKERAIEFDFSMVPHYKNGRIKYYTLPEKVTVYYPQFDGLSWDEYCEQEFNKLDMAGGYQAREKITLDTRYRNGVGLSVVRNVSAFHEKDLIDFIDWFLTDPILIERVDDRLTKKQCGEIYAGPLLAKGDIARMRYPKGNSLAVK